MSMNGEREVEEDIVVDGEEGGAGEREDELKEENTYKQRRAIRD